MRKKTFQKWKSLQDLFDMRNNFKNLRAAERAAETPFIPYLGMNESRCLFFYDTQIGVMR